MNIFESQSNQEIYTRLLRALDAQRQAGSGRSSVARAALFLTDFARLSPRQLFAFEIEQYANIEKGVAALLALTPVFDEDNALRVTVAHDAMVIDTFFDQLAIIQANADIDITPKALEKMTAARKCLIAALRTCDMDDYADLLSEELKLTLKYVNAQ